MQFSIRHMFIATLAAAFLIATYCTYDSWKHVHRFETLEIDRILKPTSGATLLASPNGWTVVLDPNLHDNTEIEVLAWAYASSNGQLAENTQKASNLGCILKIQATLLGGEYKLTPLSEELWESRGFAGLRIAPIPSDHNVTSSIEYEAQLYYSTDQVVASETFIIDVLQETK